MFSNSSPGGVQIKSTLHAPTLVTTGLSSTGGAERYERLGESWNNPVQQEQKQLNKIKKNSNKTQTLFNENKFTYRKSYKYQ